MATVASLPAQLINFEVFSSANRFLGLANVDLAEIKNKTADLSGAGLAGEIQMPTLGFTESLETTLNWQNLTADGAKTLKQTSQDLIIYGAAEAYNSSSGKPEVVKIKIEVRGLPKTFALGSFKPAESTESKTTLEVIALKISIGGTVVVEIDKVNYKFIIDGTDYLAEVRNALNI